MRRLGHLLRALDAGRLAGHHLARWILRTVEVLVIVAYGSGLVRAAWHRLAGAAAGAGGHARSLVLPIVVGLAVVAVAAILLAERHDRQRRQRQQDASTAERRSADPETERRHVAAISLAWLLSGIVLACSITAVPIGPAVLRAAIATAVACGGAVRGWRIADRARAPRPAWALAVDAARDDAPPGIGVPVVVAGTFVVALAGALGGLPTGGIGVAVALLVAVVSRRDVGRRWSQEELIWWGAVSTEVGAERVAGVRATRPEVTAWPAGVDATNRQLLRQLAQAVRDDAGKRTVRSEVVVWPDGVEPSARHEVRSLAREYDDSSVEHLTNLYAERFGRPAPGGAIAAAVAERDDAGAAAVAAAFEEAHRQLAPAGACASAIAERDARWGATVILTADRVAGDADTAADRLGERLGDSWAVVANANGLRISITPGEPERLPSFVALEKVLSSPSDPADFTLPFGENSTGQMISFDQALTPHAVIAGEVGSGKSILITSLAVGALNRGWRVAVAEIVKGGLDFLPLRPWCAGFAGELQEALSLMRATYREVLRRRDLLHRLAAVKVADLPLEVRASHQLEPFMLVFDELASALIAGAPPKGLAKNHPLVREAEDRLAATSELRLLLGKIAREARFVSISLVLGLQRPDVAILGGESGAGGELRGNLGFRCQMAPPRNLPSREAVAMLFPGEATALALAELNRLNDGISKGLGVVWAEGGGVRAVRVAYHTPIKVPALLDRLGVPRHVGPQLGESAPPSPDAPPASPDLPPPSDDLTAPDAATVPAQPDTATVATAPGVPHAPSVPIIDRRPDGSVRRVVSVAPAPDAARYGIAPKYRLVLGRAEAAAEHASDLVGLLIHDYDAIDDPVERAIARVRWAVQRRGDAQARVAGPFAMSVSTTLAERLTMKGTVRAEGEWTSAMPLVLVDAVYRVPASRPVGNILWMRTGSDPEFLESLASIGLVDSFLFLDLSEPSSAKRSDEEGVERQTAMEAMA